jgi:lipid-binding SYLF domain-containing protein
MSTSVRILGGIVLLALAVGHFVNPAPVPAATAAEIDRDVTAALTKLAESTPKAKELAAKAKGILVFPSIMKAGFMVGGQYGEGALRQGGKTVGYYNTTAASYGLQAGAQVYGYALFFMTENAMQFLDKSDGWELGSAPNVVVLDQGTAGSLSTSTLQSDMYAFFFSQKGLMAGLGLQGSKITRISK